MSTKTKSYDSTMAGAPVGSGTAGAGIAILDAVLVNGFGNTNVASLTVLAGIATATYASGHPFKVDTVALFAGATPAGLNGEKRILSKAANSVTFAATGIADGPATGAIVSKVAPAGWVKLFAGANLAVYKPITAEATGCCLLVDDSGAQVMRVRGYESMTDAASGTGPFPSVAQYGGGGLWWSKSNTASAAARAWRIVADDRGFFYMPRTIDSIEHQCSYFGDILSLKSNDPYACALRANSADRSAATSLSDDLSYCDTTQSVGGLYMPRAPNALGGAVMNHSAPILTVGLPLVHVSGATGWPYPQSADNGLILTPGIIYWPAGYRGYWPGIRFSPQIVNTAFSTGDEVPGTGDMAGKKVLVVKTGTASGAGNGVVFIDTVSDWR